MKKLFFIFCLMMIAVPCMASKDGDLHGKNEQLRFTKTEIAKISTAVGTSILSGITALTAFYTIKNDRFPRNFLKYLVNPFDDMAGGVMVRMNVNTSRTNANRVMGAYGLTAIALACASGIYVYKKLYPKQNKGLDK